MSLMTRKKVLVLNKSWTPIGTVSLKRAMIMLFSFHENGEPKAKIVEHTSYQTFTWDDWAKLRPALTDECIRSANLAFRIPEIVLLSKYDRMPAPKVHFSRRTLYKRDGMQCQYCGSKPGSEELTIDHVLPRAQGGVTSWENCILACVKCNAKKANRTPEQAHMKLLSVPKKPKANLFRVDLLERVDSWQAFLGTAYWNVELQNDMAKS